MHRGRSGTGTIKSRLGTATSRENFMCNDVSSVMYNTRRVGFGGHAVVSAIEAFAAQPKVATVSRRLPNSAVFETSPCVFLGQHELAASRKNRHTLT